MTALKVTPEMTERISYLKKFRVKDLSKNPRIVFTHRQRFSAYHDCAIAYGTKGFTTYRGNFLACYYRDPQSEYRTLTEDVGIFEVGGAERPYEFIGPDAEALMDLLTPRDITKVRPGRCAYVFITDDDGKILSDPVMVRVAKDHFWLSMCDYDLMPLIKHVAREHGLTDVVITEEPDIWPIQVQGPRSEDLLLDLFGNQIKNLSYYGCMKADLHEDGDPVDAPVVITRTGYTGLVKGFEIYLFGQQHAWKLWNALMREGMKYNIFPTAPSDLLRTIAGFFSYGCDMTSRDSVLEICRPDLVKMILSLDGHANFEEDNLSELRITKIGDYLGREAIEQQLREGVRSRLVGMRISGKKLVMSDVEFHQKQSWEVYSPDGEVLIGDLRSCAYKDDIGNVGFAKVPIEFIKIGTGLLVKHTDGHMIEAVVADMPFVDKDRLVIRGELGK